MYPEVHSRAELIECSCCSATGVLFCRVREQQINWLAFFIHPPDPHHDTIAGRTTTVDAPVTEATFIHRVGHTLPSFLSVATASEMGFYTCGRLLIAQP